MAPKAGRPLNRSDTPQRPTPPKPGRQLTAGDRRLLLARHRVARYSRRDPRAWRVLGEALHAHVLAGITVDELAAELGVSDNEVRRIRREHSDYDPVTDSGTPRQLGEWGPVAAAAIAAGTTPRQLGLRRVDAAAAGVTVLYGSRRLWHRTATAAWWTAVTSPNAEEPRPRTRHERADQARRLHSTGTPVSAIATQLRVSKATVRRDLDGSPAVPGSHVGDLARPSACWYVGNPRPRASEASASPIPSSGSVCKSGED